MQSASPSRAFNAELIFGRVRQSVGGGRFWSLLLVVLLSLTVASSTVTSNWVTGISAITGVIVGAALLLGVLALLPVPWPVALGVGAALGPVVAAVAAAPEMTHAHSEYTVYQFVPFWWAKVADGSAASDMSFYLFLICLLMWITGGWLSWCVLRWRKPLLGLIPGAAAFATNVLNDAPPWTQAGYTLAMLVLTLALLLWTNYTGSIATAAHAHMKLTGDARWDFWETGLVAMAALIVLGIMLPPLSTGDRTTALENSMFSSWAQLQERLAHPGFNAGAGGAGVTGFSTEVKLGGPLQRTRDVVFTYTSVGATGSPAYFRGVDDTVTVAGVWKSSSLSSISEHFGKNEVPVYSETYDKQLVERFDIRMWHAPNGYGDLLFYPGQLYKIDRATLGIQAPVAGCPPRCPLASIDVLRSRQPTTSAGSYTIFVETSGATAQELQTAGTDYPTWVQGYATLPDDGTYRNPEVLGRIHDLALQITANAPTPYDKAAAIESYLRSNAFKYNINATRPAGTDAMSWFLFNSKQGYCEYFATAMGDMLRSLGIPTRLVNGYGPGQFDTHSLSFVVRGEDAHTWVEVYFPKYGWIPFEPTNDNVYKPITRGVNGPCARETGCDNPGTPPGTEPPGPPIVAPRGPAANSGGRSTGGGFSLTALGSATLTKVVAIALAVVLLLLAAGARYLRPRTVMAVWKRTLALARLAGAERRPGETPLELGRRLQRVFPEASEPMGALASGFGLAAYAPPELASTARSSVMEAWSALRPLLLRRVFARLRPARS